MTQDEKIAWARAEMAQRLADLRRLEELPLGKREAALADVQRAAKRRRRAAGIPSGEVYTLLRAAGREQEASAPVTPEGQP